MKPFSARVQFIVSFLLLASAFVLVAAQSPEGVISGRLVDTKGEPGPGIRILVQRVEYRYGRRTLVDNAPESNPGFVTDDRGNFRIFGLSPGDYYLTTVPFGPYLLGTGPVAKPPTGSADLLRVMYYPGVSSLYSAEPIHVHPGEEVRLMDFRSREAPGGVRLSGTVSLDAPVKDPSSASAFSPLYSSELLKRLENDEEFARGFKAGAESGKTQFQVELIPHDRNMLMQRNPFALEFMDFPLLRGGAPGTFSVQGVPAGTYDLVLINRANKIQSEPVAVEVRNQDITGLRAMIHSVTVHGRVSIEAGRTLTLQDLRGVELRPAHRAYSLPEVLLNSEGEFIFSDVSSGRYEVLLFGLTAEGCVEGLRYGEHNLDAPEISIESKPQPLEIRVRGECGSLEGDVRIAGATPAAEVRVVLVPAPSLRSYTSLYKEVTADGSGHFVLQGIPSGEYKVFAWASIPDTVFMNPEFIRHYEDRGLSVRVAGSSNQEIRLDLLQD